MLVHQRVSKQISQLPQPTAFCRQQPTPPAPQEAAKCPKASATILWGETREKDGLYAQYMLMLW